MAKKAKKELKPEKKKEGFDWNSLIVPDMDKILRSILILLISAGSFSLLVLAKNISTSSVSIAISDIKIVGLLLSCYLFACYTAARNIDYLKTAFIVFVPEMLIVLYLVYRIG